MESQTRFQVILSIEIEPILVDSSKAWWKVMEFK